MRLIDADYLTQLFGREPKKWYIGQTVLDEIERTKTINTLTLSKAAMILRLVEAAMNKGGQHITVMPDGEVSIWEMDEVPVLTVDQISKWLDRVVSRVEFNDQNMEHAYMMYGWKGIIEQAIKDGDFDGD